MLPPAYRQAGAFSHHRRCSWQGWQATAPACAGEAQPKAGQQHRPWQACPRRPSAQRACSWPCPLRSPWACWQCTLSALTTRRCITWPSRPPQVCSRSRHPQGWGAPAQCSLRQSRAAAMRLSLHPGSCPTHWQLLSMPAFPAEVLAAHAAGAHTPPRLGRPKCAPGRSRGHHLRCPVPVHPDRPAGARWRGERGGHPAGRHAGPRHVPGCARDCRGVGGPPGQAGSGMVACPCAACAWCKAPCSLHAWRTLAAGSCLLDAGHSELCAGLSAMQSTRSASCWAASLRVSCCLLLPVQLTQVQPVPHQHQQPAPACLQECCQPTAADAQSWKPPPARSTPAWDCSCHACWAPLQADLACPGAVQLPAQAC